MRASARLTSGSVADRVIIAAMNRLIGLSRGGRCSPRMPAVSRSSAAPSAATCDSNQTPRFAAVHSSNAST